MLYFKKILKYSQVYRW